MMNNARACGSMAELADATDLKSVGFGRLGSNPSTPTKFICDQGIGESKADSLLFYMG